MSEIENKWWLSILLGIMFFIISSPASYFGTSTLSTCIGGISLTENGAPNYIGLIFHSLLFIIVARLII